MKISVRKNIGVYIGFIGDQKNAELWEGKGHKFRLFLSHNASNMLPFPSHNSSFFGSPINLILEFCT